jgi:hypothetical protein
MSIALFSSFILTKWQNRQVNMDDGLQPVRESIINILENNYVYCFILLHRFLAGKRD